MLINESIQCAVEAIIAPHIPWWVTLLAAIGGVALLYGVHHFGAYTINIISKTGKLMLKIIIAVIWTIRKWKSKKRMK